MDKISNEQIIHDLAVQLAVKNLATPNIEQLAKNYILYRAELRKIFKQNNL